MDTEKASETASLKGNSPSSSEKVFDPFKGIKKKKNQFKKKKDAASAVVLQDLDKSGRLECAAAIVLIIVGLSIYGIYYYYSSVSEARNIIDSDKVIITEKWLDYSTGIQVNCTSQHTCDNWNCSYVHENFKKNPDECDYKDHKDIINLLLILLVILAICQKICG